jgi:signal transduction histidine kinase
MSWRRSALGNLARIQGPVPREVRPLVDEVNRLLVLLEQRVRQSRTAVGNLAHALKTPLAVLLQAGEAPACPRPCARRCARRPAPSMSGSIANCAGRGWRGPGGHGAGAHFNPGAELPALVRMLKSVHHEKALGIEVLAPDRRLPFDREDMLELLGNLADNACKWARQRVRIELSERPANAAKGRCSQSASATMVRGVPTTRWPSCRRAACGWTKAAAVMAWD